jgi:hypothetical protein
MSKSYAEEGGGDEADFCFVSVCSWKLAKALAACVTNDPSYAHLCVLAGRGGGGGC